MAFRYVYPDERERAVNYGPNPAPQGQNNNLNLGLKALDKFTTLGSEGGSTLTGMTSKGPAGMADISGLAAAEAGMSSGGGAVGMADVSGLAAAEAGMGGGGATAGEGVAGAGMGAGALWGAVAAAIVANEYNAIKTGDRREGGKYGFDLLTADVLKDDIEGRFSKYTGGEDSFLTKSISAAASPAYADPRSQFDAYKGLLSKIF